MKAKKSSSSKILLSFLLVALASFFLRPVGAAQPIDAAAGAETTPAQAVPKQGMKERVSLDLRSTEVTDALKYLATKGELNLAISKNVAGRVNLFLNDIPIHDVFDLILRSNELAYDRQGAVYNVMTEAEYRALYGKKFSDLRQVKTFRLQYAVPQQAFNLLDTLKSEIGRLLVDEESGTVLVMDTPEKLAKMEEALATLEKGGTIRVFDLKYAKAKDMEERLKDQIETNKLGFVKADPQSNQMIVKTLPDRMKDVEKMIAALDRRTREVLIDAKIVKVTLSNKLTSGIDWSTVFSNLKFNGLEPKNPNDFRPTTTGTAPSEVPSVTRIPLVLSSVIGGEQLKLGTKLLFTTIARDGYELFRYLETVGDTRVISSPRMLVTEAHEAKIHVGTREAYITTTTTTGQTTATTAEDVKFIDVGIQFSVTPTINSEGYITMKLKPEISSVVRTLTTPSKNQIPIVDTSIAETEVMVKDGSTLIIGGLRTNQKQFSNDQIPFLGRIPILGEPFKRRSKDDKLQELVVFITPHIVSGDVLVSGDERSFGGGIKDTREYNPVVENPPLPPSETESPTNKEIPPAQREPPPVKLRLHDELRTAPGRS